jgi:hypothetical protein
VYRSNLPQHLWLGIQNAVAALGNGVLALWAKEQYAGGRDGLRWRRLHQELAGSAGKFCPFCAILDCLSTPPGHLIQEFRSIGRGVGREGRSEKKKWNALNLAIPACRRIAVSPYRRIAVSPCRRVAVRRVGVRRVGVIALPAFPAFPAWAAGTGNACQRYLSVRLLR